ncbi:Type IV conjugative transfer system signal peptidase TraF (plasmid) [Candidatus Protochlamydia naegleriophila]|uniref:Type IV conjugative transfer system signal peptidase TraF n=1 Tax=Candidatus Protochlamydia naegleriophila TaxID=389348 RepID=A0A0U5CSZ0_9BACT|nr:S26 family signal peptidase [Candidatus Protochlamydia naegleriophila]CUI18204.1 Type IV conjugative transfer system signal peptidase TraF [Candidatus Protochlamydia naegleriophila]
MRRGKLLKSLVIFYVVVGAYLICDYAFKGFRINTSESLPFYFFTSSKIEHIQRDMYVTIRHPLSKSKLAKQIVGIPGDLICIENGMVHVAGKVYGEILTHSRSGSIMTPIKEGFIPEGYFFVYAMHPQSFDSRYAEFGLVQLNQLVEELCPLL